MSETTNKPSKVVSIGSHPEFQPCLDNEGSTPERDQYLDYLEGQASQSGSEGEDNFQVVKIKKALSICVECKFKRDQRPRWKKLLFPGRVAIDNLFCRAFPLVQTRCSVTGNSGYRLPSTEIFYTLRSGIHQAPCWYLNPIGDCEAFESKNTC